MFLGSHGVCGLDRMVSVFWIAWSLFISCNPGRLVQCVPYCRSCARAARRLVSPRLRLWISGRTGGASWPHGLANCWDRLLARCQPAAAADRGGRGGRCGWPRTPGRPGSGSGVCDVRPTSASETSQSTERSGGAGLSQHAAAAAAAVRPSGQYGQTPRRHLNWGESGASRDCVHELICTSTALCCPPLPPSRRLCPIGPHRFRLTDRRHDLIHGIASRTRGPWCRGP